MDLRDLLSAAFGINPAQAGVMDYTAVGGQGPLGGGPIPPPTFGDPNSAGIVNPAAPASIIGLTGAPVVHSGMTAPAAAGDAAGGWAALGNRLMQNMGFGLDDSGSPMKSALMGGTTLPGAIVGKGNEDVIRRAIFGGAPRVVADASPIPSYSLDPSIASAFAPQRDQSFTIGPAKSISMPALQGLKPHEQALLNAIAAPESGGAYDVRYTPKGPARFTDFSQHPGIMEAGPEGPTSASGRYQFVKKTWDGLGGGDFSPENQDARALQLARQVYNKNGRDLDADLQKTGMTPEIMNILTPTWQGFGANPTRAMAAYNATIQQGSNGAMPGAPTMKSAQLPGAPQLPMPQLPAATPLPTPQLPQAPTVQPLAPVDLSKAQATYEKARPTIMPINPNENFFRVLTALGGGAANAKGGIGSVLAGAGGAAGQAVAGWVDSERARSDLYTSKTLPDFMKGLASFQAGVAQNDAENQNKVIIAGNKTNEGRFERDKAQIGLTADTQKSNALRQDSRDLEQAKLGIETERTNILNADQRIVDQLKSDAHTANENTKLQFENNLKRWQLSLPQMHATDKGITIQTLDPQTGQTNVRSMGFDDLNRQLDQAKKIAEVTGKDSAESQTNRYLLAAKSGGTNMLKMELLRDVVDKNYGQRLFGPDAWKDITAKAEAGIPAGVKASPKDYAQTQKDQILNILRHKVLNGTLADKDWIPALQSDGNIGARMLQGAK